MIAFLNDIEIKTKYLDRVKAHAKADEIVKGQYWQEGKGCAVGWNRASEVAYASEIHRNDEGFDSLTGLTPQLF